MVRLHSAEKLCNILLKLFELNVDSHLETLLPIVVIFLIIFNAMQFTFIVAMFTIQPSIVLSLC